MAELLDRIDGPSDLKGLTYPELDRLSEEIRTLMVSTVTRTGGHLASSLGAVELTIALHRVFDSPRDKLVWDVGHQSYAHKLLTGRRERFDTLRQYGGLSGFPDPDESPHDAFGTGHASTSVSAALGIALGRDLAADDYSVVAVIGDGSLTGGMAFEGLNHIGHLGTRMIVLLNDNAMAISPSVGALSRILDGIRLDPRYHKTKEGAGRVVTSMPGGKAAWRWFRRLKLGLKGIILPTQIWEALGFKYIGPVDGHNIYQLEKALAKAHDYSVKPVFVHVLTTKGKGYEPAEEDSVKFHGISARSTASAKAPSYSEVFCQTVLDLFREDERLVAITAAMMEGTGLSLVAREFPKRVFDVGICEQHAVTFAAGLATRGFIPIVAIYSTFLQRAFDQIVHDVCSQKLPVVFAIDRAGIVGDDGKTHQGTLDLSYLCCIPNLVVAAPRDENELRHLLYTCVNCGRPAAIRYPRGTSLGVPLEDKFRTLPIGKGQMLRDGRDAVIVAIGNTVAPSVDAARDLSEQGMSCAVIDARFAKPLDSDLIVALANRTKRVVTVEENVLAGGFGGAVAAMVSDIADVRVLRIGLPDEFIGHGAQGILRSSYSLDAKGIAQRIEAFLVETADSSSPVGIRR
ncbi:MAG: 1-deoxy-D-xylulose-5-phosphate synthase [Dehalococcoidia bacterium]